MKQNICKSSMGLRVVFFCSNLLSAIRVDVLTLNSERHALADVGAHPVGGLTQVKATILLQDVADEQRAVVHDLYSARQRHGMVLLWVPNTR